jgi:hypothetical protein
MSEDYRDDPELGREVRRLRSYGRAGAWRPLEIVKFADMKARLDGRPLIKGYLDREQISLIVGDPGSGKTFLALDRDLHIAAGIDWHGCKVSQGPVVYIAAEAGRSIQNRVAAWRQEHGFNNSDIPFAAITSPVDLCHGENGCIDQILECIKQLRIPSLALLEIDTVSRALAGGNENSPEDMGGFIASVDQLRETLRCHVSAVHHFGKEHNRGARGHSSLFGGIDTETQVDNGIARVTKQRDGVVGKEFPFKLHPVTLGHDADGDPVTSCIVESANGATAKPETPISAKLSDKQKITLNVLKYALTVEGNPAPASNHIPAQKICINDEMWRRYYMSKIPADGQDENTRRKAFREARNALMSKGLIGTFNGLVWLSQ